MDMSIKNIVKDRMVHFVYYRQKTLYYKVDLDGEWYMFPVPIDDLMEASCNVTERAITLMRYIRKAIDKGAFVRYYE